MGSSLVFAVRHAENRPLASSNTCAGSFVIRKAYVHDYKYVREFPIQLGGAKAKLIIRKFRAMLHDRERMLVVCERNGMVCAFGALKLRELSINGIDFSVQLIEYFGLKSFERADDIAVLLESAIYGMADKPENGNTSMVGVEMSGLGAWSLEFYNNRGFREVNGVLFKVISGA
jgi:hypothetical protein